MITGKKIAIIGGGPGGLTLARLLQIKGADVTVYERDAGRHVRVQGATLDLHEESGLAAIRAAGLLDAFKAVYRPGADKMRIVNKHGDILLDDHAEKPGEDFGNEHFRPEIDRGPLRDILLDSLQPGTVRWNSHIVALEQEGEQWTIHCSDGHIAYADLVIGADGGNSRIRPFITPLKPIYSGITVVEGTLYDAAIHAPRLQELVKGGKVFALGDGKTLILSAKGDGSLSFYTGCVTPENWAKEGGVDFNNPKEVLNWFTATFTGWDIIWNELFASDQVSFIPRPQYYMPLDQSWQSRPGITLIGDAAHLMPPYAGEGVNMAMLDALELSDCFTKGEFTDTLSAIQYYEEHMRKRASETARMTLEQTDSMHSAEGLNELLRMFKGE